MSWVLLVSGVVLVLGQNIFNVFTILRQNALSNRCDIASERLKNLEAATLYLGREMLRRDANQKSNAV